MFAVGPTLGRVSCGGTKRPMDASPVDLRPSKVTGQALGDATLWNLLRQAGTTSPFQRASLQTSPFLNSLCDCYLRSVLGRNTLHVVF